MTEIKNDEKMTLVIERKTDDFGWVYLHEVEGEEIAKFFMEHNYLKLQLRARKETQSTVIFERDAWEPEDISVFVMLNAAKDICSDDQILVERAIAVAIAEVCQRTPVRRVKY